MNGLLDEAQLTKKVIKSICTQNGQTLESLSLFSCEHLSLTFLQQIIENCIKLKEIGIGNFSFPESILTYLAENLPSRIEKLDISGSDICDQLLNTLIVRCTNLKSLCLNPINQITNDTKTTRKWSNQYCDVYAFLCQITL